MSTQWKLMPFPPTDEMIEAGDALDCGFHEGPITKAEVEDIYAAMWEAAPTANVAIPAHIIEHATKCRNDYGNGRWNFASLEMANFILNLQENVK